MRAHWLLALSLAFTPALLDCGATSDVRPAGKGLYVYDLARPDVDVAYAVSAAARFGVHGNAISDGSVYRVDDSPRVVIVHKETGGIRFYDHGKLNADDYRIDTSRAHADVERIATAYLRARAMLPDGALVNAVRVENGRGGVPNHWAVSYGFRLAAGVDADGNEIGASLKGALATLFVGNDEVIGMEWDCPTLARRPGTLPDTAGMLKHAVEGTDSTVGFIELSYWYNALGENMAHLDPRGVYAPLGAGLDVRSATFRPQLADDAMPVEYVAGEAIELDAPELSGGTPPFAYRWEADVIGDSSPALSIDKKLVTILPVDAVGLRLKVTDAEGMTAERRYTVGNPHPESVPLLPRYEPGPIGINPSFFTHTLSGTNAAWTMDLGDGPVNHGGGLVLSNIRVSGRLVADRWSMPSVVIKTKGMAGGTWAGGLACNIGAGCPVKLIENTCWNGTISSPSLLTSIACKNSGTGTDPSPWALSDKWRIHGGQAYYKRPFLANDLTIRNVWSLNMAQYTSTDCNLVIAQTYIFEPVNSYPQNCDNISANQCAKYYPVVQYWYMNSAMTAACGSDEVAQITFDQKFEHDVWDHASSSTGDVALYINDMADVNIPFTSFNPQLTERTATMAIANVPPNEEYWASGDNTTKDNYHERADQNLIYVPGCYSKLDTPTMQCAHMHWRWGLPCGVPFLCPGPSSQVPFHIGYPLVPGSQTVTTSVALERDAEFLQPGPAIANGENIVTIAGVQGSSSVQYFGSKLVMAVDTTCQSAAGRNGGGELIGQSQGAKYYDQIGLNSYFFE